MVSNNKIIANPKIFAAMVCRNGIGREFGKDVPRTHTRQAELRALAAIEFSTYERFESGGQESRKGFSEMEGKVARVSTSELGSERVSIEEWSARTRDIEGKTARVAARDRGDATFFKWISKIEGNEIQNRSMPNNGPQENS